MGGGGVKKMVKAAAAALDSRWLENLIVFVDLPGI